MDLNKHHVKLRVNLAWDKSFIVPLDEIQDLLDKLTSYQVLQRSYGKDPSVVKLPKDTLEISLIDPDSLAEAMMNPILNEQGDD